MLLEHPSPKPEDIGSPAHKGILKMTSHHTIQFRSQSSNGTKRKPSLLFRPKRQNELYLFTTVIWVRGAPPGSVRLHWSNLESVKTPISMPNIRRLSQFQIPKPGSCTDSSHPRISLSEPQMRPNSSNKLQGHKTTARQNSRSGHPPKITIRQTL